MAYYRAIHCKIWADPDFVSYDNKKKLIFLYLCTNPYVTESGVYQIATKTISNDTGIDVSEVENILRNEFKNIYYDYENSYVFVKNLRRYSTTGGRPELIKRCIELEYINSRKTKLWDLFFDEYREYASIINKTKQNKEQSAPASENSQNEQTSDIISDTESENIYSIYEREIGLITPGIAEELKIIETEYPTEWFAKAVKIAVENNTRKLSYIKAIMERWKTNGFTEIKKRKKTKAGLELYE